MHWEGYKVGIFGLGKKGTAYARAILSQGGLVVGFDPKRDKDAILADMGENPTLEDAAKRLSMAGSEEALLDSDGLFCYIIATPPRQRGMVAEAMNRNHAFVEKPIGLIDDFSTVSNFVNAARKSSNQIYVGHSELFHSFMTQLQSFIDAGFRVRTGISQRWKSRLNDRRPTEPFYSQELIHDIAFWNSVLSYEWFVRTGDDRLVAPISVRAYSTGDLVTIEGVRLEGEVFAVLHYDTGRTVKIDGSFHNPYGTKKKIALGTHDNASSAVVIDHWRGMQEHDDSCPYFTVYGPGNMEGRTTTSHEDPDIQTIDTFRGMVEGTFTGSPYQWRPSVEASLVAMYVAACANKSARNNSDIEIPSLDEMMALQKFPEYEYLPHA